MDINVSPSYEVIPTIVAQHSQAIEQLTDDSRRNESQHRELEYQLAGIDANQRESLREIISVKNTVQKNAAAVDKTLKHVLELNAEFGKVKGSVSLLEDKVTNSILNENNTLFSDTMDSPEDLDDIFSEDTKAHLVAADMPWVVRKMTEDRIARIKAENVISTSTPAPASPVAQPNLLKQVVKLLAVIVISCVAGGLLQRLF
jgi:hypothetical protein